MAMISPKIPLVLDPQCELFFWGPFKEQVKAILKLQNCSDRLVFYKIRSTQSNHIFIKQNPGHLQPGEEVDIDVVLCHGDDMLDSQLMLKVLSTIAPDGDFNSETIWEDTAEDDVMESLLEGHLVMPDEVEEVEEEEEFGDEEEEDFGDEKDFGADDEEEDTNDELA